MSKSLVAEINEILDDYFVVVKEEGFVGAAKDVAQECVDRLKAVNWETNTGKQYSKTWKVKMQRDGSFIVHNPKNYQLTHLLENGHVVVNGKGVYGRARAFKHIEPVYIWAQEELMREIKARLERGL